MGTVRIMAAAMGAALLLASCASNSGSRSHVMSPEEAMLRNANGQREVPLLKELPLLGQLFNKGHLLVRPDNQPKMLTLEETFEQWRNEAGSRNSLKLVAQLQNAESDARAQEYLNTGLKLIELGEMELAEDIISAGLHLQRFPEHATGNVNAKSGEAIAWALFPYRDYIFSAEYSASAKREEPQPGNSKSSDADELMGFEVSKTLHSSFAEAYVRSKVAEGDVKLVTAGPRSVFVALQPNALETITRALEAKPDESAHIRLRMSLVPLSESEVGGYLDGATEMPANSYPYYAEHTGADRSSVLALTDSASASLKMRLSALRESGKGVHSSLTSYPGIGACLSTLNQVAYIQDFEIYRTDDAMIADPVVGVINDGYFLEMIALPDSAQGSGNQVFAHLSFTLSQLLRPIPTFTTQLIKGGAPVTIQIPEVRIGGVHAIGGFEKDKVYLAPHSLSVIHDKDDGFVKEHYYLIFSFDDQGYEDEKVK